MASNTPKLGLCKKDPVADGNDTFNIETMLNENWDKIDNNVAQAPFTIKSTAYDAANNRIACTFGQGLVELFNGDARVLVEINDGATYYISNPVINTIYYLYLLADGNFTHNTSGIVPAGGVLLHQVATGADLNTVTATDRRAVVSGVGAKVAAHLAETMPHRFMDGITTYRWGLSVIDGVVNMVYEEVV